MQSIKFFTFTIITLILLGCQESQPTATLAFGGDVFLGRYTNQVISEKGYEHPFLDVKPIFENADHILVNLECVISNQGNPADKKEMSPYYFRARPNLVHVLTYAGVTIISGANNHSGDYGPMALTHQMEILNQNNVEYVGIGSNLEEAKRFKIIEAQGIKIAVIGVDATQSTFKADKFKPGTNHFATNEPGDFFNYIKQTVNEASNYAHVVLLTVHWGKNNVSRPTSEIRALAAQIMNMTEIDGILGHSAHLVHGIEIINNKPIIYDAGNLLLDYNGNGWQNKSLIFKLTIAHSGIRKIEMFPIKLFKGKTITATQQDASEILNHMKTKCAELGTLMETRDNGGVIQVKTRNKLAKRLKNQPEVTVRPEIYNPDMTPGIIRQEIPENTVLEKITFENGVEFLGYSKPVDSIKKNQGFFLTTYWTSEKEINGSYLISPSLEPLDSKGPKWKDSDTFRSHQPGDWSYPTSHWKPGEIIEDHYFIRGHKNSSMGSHKIGISVLDPSNNKFIPIVEPSRLNGQSEIEIGKITITR